MAQEPEYESEAMYNATRDALVAKGADLHAPCPVCQQTAWRIPGGTLRMSTIRTDGRLGGTPQRPEGTEAIPVICDHCGFMRLHDAPTLLGFQDASR